MKEIVVHDIPTAGDLIDRIVAEASARLMRFAPTPGAREMAYAGLDRPCVTAYPPLKR